MTLTFRKLTNDDIETVLDISQHIWDGHDYIPRVIKEWIESEDKDPYGAFENNELVGFGSIEYFKGVGWIEGVRVHPNHQKKGIGYQLFNYGVILAKKREKRIVQFATYSLNHASISIGKKLGFKIRNKMNVLHIPAEHRESFKNKVDSNYSDLCIKILEDNLISKYFKNKIRPPVKYICKGWSFFPIDDNLFHTISGEWFAYNNALVLCKKEEKEEEEEKEKTNNENDYPGKEICLICYGENYDLEKLMNSVLIRNNYTRYENIEIFCPEIFVKVVKQYGFEYWDQKEGSVVLLDKR